MLSGPFRHLLPDPVISAFYRLSCVGDYTYQLAYPEARGSGIPTRCMQKPSWVSGWPSRNDVEILWIWVNPLLGDGGDGEGADKAVSHQETSLFLLPLY